MPANLTPQYKKAEEEYRRAQTAEETARPCGQPPDEPSRLEAVPVSGRVVSRLGLGVVRHLAIELVAVGPDGNDVHIHY